MMGHRATAARRPDYAGDMSTAPSLLPLSRSITEPASPALRRVTTALERLMRRLVLVDWRGEEHLQGGGLVLAANHISYADFLSMGHFVLASGRWPHFLGKESLFRIPLVGRLITACEQIPVHRGSARATDALASAVAAVRAGKLVAIYPEGTITKDPQQWPMRGRSGAVRIALESGRPLVPVAQWGAQELMPGPRPSLPRPWPRKTMRVAAGPPVDLSAYRGKEITSALISEATAVVMARITELLAELRDGDPPAQPYRP